MKKTTTVIGFCAFLTFFSGCSGGEEPNPAGQNQEIIVQNAMVAFPNYESFKATYTDVLDGRLSIDSFCKDLSGYTSLKSAYDEFSDRITNGEESDALELEYNNILTTINEHGEESLVRITPNHFFASVFNEKGLLMVGDQVYKIYLDKIKTASVDDFDFSTSDMENVKRVNVLAIDRKILTVNSETGDGRIEAKTGNCSIEFKTGGDKFRVLGNIYYETLTDASGFNYKAFVPTVRFQRKKNIFSSWKPHTTFQLYIAGEYYRNSDYYRTDGDELSVSEYSLPPIREGIYTLQNPLVTSMYETFGQGDGGVYAWCSVEINDIN